MAIRIIYGPGGSGKSFHQLHIVTEQLRETKRNISTNLAIDLPKYQEWLELNYPNEVLDCARRVRILTESETREFWKHRGPMRWLNDANDSCNPYLCEYDKGDLGCCFIIDEAGAAGFSAGGWASKEGQTTRGESCTWYLDQQRKFGDDVYASCNGRTPAAIAKPFRDKAHGFIKLRNEHLASYGIFRGRGRFKWKLYEKEPTGQLVESIAEGTFVFGSGLENCYRTQDGFGIVGKAADKGARAKGIPILWVLPVIALAMVLAIAIPWGFSKIAQKAMSSGTVVKNVGNHIAGTVDQPKEGEKKSKKLEVISSHVVLEASGPDIFIELSDGRVLRPGNPSLGAVFRNYVVVDGQPVEFQKREDREKAKEQEKNTTYAPPVAAAVLGY